MPHKLITSSLVMLVMLVAAISLTSCSRGGTNSTSPSGTEDAQSSPAPPKSVFETDLEFVRKGQYTYIWVFSRKDGKTIDKNDGDYLRKNAPQVVDWVMTEEGRKVIAGTNFDLAKGNLDLIKKRYNVEDYSGR